MKQGPFSLVMSISPWWLKNHSIVMEPPLRMGQSTVSAPVWRGPTPLVLGPSSWGFGIGPAQGTAYAPAPHWPQEVPLYKKPGPYGL